MYKRGQLCTRGDSCVQEGTAVYVMCVVYYVFKQYTQDMSENTFGGGCCGGHNLQQSLYSHLFHTLRAISMSVKR